MQRAAYAEKEALGVASPIANSKVVFGVRHRDWRSSPTWYQSCVAQGTIHAVGALPGRVMRKNEDVLREILWLLNAGDYILDIRRISANLLRLLPTFREISAQSCKKDEFIYELFAGWEVFWSGSATISRLEFAPRRAGTVIPITGIRFNEILFGSTCGRT